MRAPALRKLGYEVTITPYAKLRPRCYPGLGEDFRRECNDPITMSALRRMQAFAQSRLSVCYPLRWMLAVCQHLGFSEYKMGGGLTMTLILAAGL